MIEIIDIPAFRAACGFVSKDRKHEALTGVRLEADGSIVGLDGYALFKSTDCATDVEEAVTIKPAKLISAKNTTVVIDLKTRMIEGNLERIPFEIITASYPPYEQVIPDKDRGEGLPSIGIGTRATLKMLKALDGLKGTNDTLGLKWSFDKDPMRPILITCSTRPGMTVVHMPARV